VTAGGQPADTRALRLAVSHADRLSVRRIYYAVVLSLLVDLVAMH
jgi:hypothetical protein